MKKIEELTEEQDHLMAQLSAEYEAYALSGDDSYDVKEIQKGIDFLYELAELKPPQEIIVCASPIEMKQLLGMKKGETFDWIGCGYDSGWTAFYDYMQRIGVEFDQEWGFDRWKDFITKSGVFAVTLCENAAFVCVRPSQVHRNSAGDLHNEKGMAILWADGYGEYSLNGVLVEESLVMTPAEKLDPTMLLKEQNAEVRREIVRKIGIERVVQKLGAKKLDESHEGMYELLLLELGDGRERPYLKMRNPSINAYHLEGVPPGTKTVKEALAWRNGREESPLVLT